MPFSKASNLTLSFSGEFDYNINGQISCRSYVGLLIRHKSLLYAHGTIKHRLYPSQPLYISTELIGA